MMKGLNIYYHINPKQHLSLGKRPDEDVSRKDLCLICNVPIMFQLFKNEKVLFIS